MPKIVDHDERRTHIVEAATNVIIREGFDRLTMREIAAEAGYAHGAITRYFPNKQNLLTAAFLHVFRGSQDRILRRVGDSRGLAALATLATELLPYSRVGPQRAMVVLAFWNRAAQDPELHEIHHREILDRRSMIRRFLTEAREDGELHPSVDIEAAVNRVSVHNAGWQMLATLVPETATAESLDASIAGLIAELRSPTVHGASLP